MVARTPLTARPLDLMWFSFFLMHIPATVLMDLQALFFPKTYLPGILHWYVQWTNDPIIRGAMYDANMYWMRCFLTMELFFQLPTFFVAAYGLYKNHRGIYPLILIYATSAATTTIPCVVAVFHHADSLNTEQQITLLASYMPFLLCFLGMTVDMYLRLMSIVRVADAQRQVKEKTS
ncbi:hypothetical protein CYLTODRAFT_373655 [Cylindrobasidium torrendii FP15055 ss-10]|uniref:Efficient mitochondria targeting-associated protein 19 n=1 Tax=Cylindrobasidium torrendii FP15055 ss-10 TaxID=1314674 RepID=A0A0D7BEA2_9AGAR|nr:hypothetical protein CYLTODRAFT_373655 [Cylindrobasidium torrendii FP15055 ss-10]